MEKVWSLDCNLLEEHRAIELIPAADGSTIAGALMIDMRTGKYRLVGPNVRSAIVATAVDKTW